MQEQKLSFFDFVKGLAQLVRLPNLLIIVLTQLLLRYCIILPWIYPEGPEAGASLADFLVLVLITVLIASGGYVINDYFDVKIDLINRPGKTVVNKVISRQAAITMHMVLNAAAILLGFYLAWRVKSVSFGLVFPLISGLLWIYSAKYKRMLFWGNFIVACLSAFVILVVWLFEFFRLRLIPEQFSSQLQEIRLVTNILLAYSAFAFLVTMVREIIKDLEDAEGDETAGCRTLPIVAGRKLTRYIAGSILVITVMLLGYAQVILYRLGNDTAFWYFMATVQPASLLMLGKLSRARSRKDFQYLSNLCKLIMVAGILSMALLFLLN